MWASVQAWDSAASFLDAVQNKASQFRTGRQDGQPQELLVWCETRGMVQMLAGVANEYGIDVLSTSGCDSTSIRHHIGTTCGGEGRVILHVGDLHKDGVAIFRAAAEDVTAWAEHSGGRVEFVRLAVTPEQVEELGLPGDPDQPGNVQAEAIPPGVMTQLLRDAINSRLDQQVYATTSAYERIERQRAIDAIGAPTDERNG